MNFIEDYLSGKVTKLEDIDDYTDLWHDDKIEGELADAWGVTEDEYFELIGSEKFYDTLARLVNKYRQYRVASALQKVKDIIDKFN